MSKATEALEFSCEVKLPPQNVYYAFTNATALREWLCSGAQVNATADGWLFLWWNSGYSASGEFKQLEPDKALTFTWNGRNEPGTTQVEIALTSQGGGTLVKVIHSGLGSGSEWETPRKEIQEGWEQGLENLQSVLETGTDLRVARLPMLGIIPTAVIDADLAKRLGLPVNEGLQISTVVEGMGAEAAGLQEGDVLVGLGGVPVRNGATLAQAIRPFQAGDEIEVVFYRAKEKKTVTMRLSSRQVPEVPPQSKDLAKAVQNVYAELSAELDQILAGVTEEEASQSPAEGEWSVKEVLAHLIYATRDPLMWVGTLIAGNEMLAFPDNSPAMIEAAVESYGTLPNLLDELKRAQGELVLALSRLPDEFIARKGSYIRVGESLLGIAYQYHHRTHFEQLRAILDAVRQ